MCQSLGSHLAEMDGAALAIAPQEDMSTLLSVAQRYHRRGRAIGWHLQRADIDSRLRQQFNQKAPRQIIADRAQRRHFQSHAPRRQDCGAGAARLEAQRTRSLMFIRHRRQLHFQQHIHDQIANRDQRFQNLCASVPLWQSFLCSVRLIRDHPL